MYLIMLEIVISRTSHRREPLGNSINLSSQNKQTHLKLQFVLNSPSWQKATEKEKSFSRQKNMESVFKVLTNFLEDWLAYHRATTVDFCKKSYWFHFAAMKCTFRSLLLYILFPAFSYTLIVAAFMTCLPLKQYLSLNAMAKHSINCCGLAMACKLASVLEPDPLVWPSSLEQSVLLKISL